MGGVPVEAHSTLAAHGMALVFGDAAPGGRNHPGGRAITCGPIHLPATDWTLHGADLAGGEVKNEPRRPGRAHGWCRWNAHGLRLATDRMLEE